MNQTESNNETDVQLPDTQDPDKTEIDEYDKVKFFPVSEGKLITLYILSFGFYGIYWFYKNWKLQESEMDKKIYPVWRGIFSIFFTHSLFKRIDQQAMNLEKKHQFNANWLATLFVIALVVSNIIDSLSTSTALFDNISNSTVIISSLVIFLLSTYPLARVQATVNRINNDMLGYLNNEYSLWNYILIVAGVCFWILAALGILTDSMGIVIPE